MRKIIAAVLAVAVASCDSTPTQPSVTTTQNGSSCSAQGNGNTVICSAPTPTPTPTPAPKCAKTIPLYQENVVQATAGIPLGQSRASHQNALVAALQRAGFKVLVGGVLPEDELALKLTDFSETYDFWRADNTPQVLYQQTCSPPIF